MHAVINAPPLKDGSGKELRKLHDNLQQHLRALGTLGCDLPGTFIMSMIELKLDTNKLFEWQKHSQDDSEVPPYEQLLTFIDMRAQASETSCSSHKKSFVLPPKRSHTRLTSYVTNAKSENKCVVCKTERHPLYLCAKFKAMSHEDKTQVCKMNRLCTVTELDISRPNASLHTDAGSAKDLIIPSFTWRCQSRMKQSHLTCPLSLWDLLLLPLVCK